MPRTRAAYFGGNEHMKEQVWAIKGETEMCIVEYASDQGQLQDLDRVPGSVRKAIYLVVTYFCVRTVHNTNGLFSL